MQNRIKSRIAAALGLTVALAAGSMTFMASRAGAQESPAFRNQDTNLLAQVQGKWSWGYEKHGQKFHCVKEIKGNQLIMNTYDDHGDAVYGHVCDCRVQRQGALRIFTFWNVMDTVGPNKGKPVYSKPYSFIYRIMEDGTLAEAHGFFGDEQRSAEFRVWHRVE
jgi:hypothetical protein